MKNIKEKVMEAYSTIKQSGSNPGSCCGTSSGKSTCCGSGFLKEEYDNQPPMAACAGIASGDTVVDLCSGTGNDIFIVRPSAGVGFKHCM
jgi:hypothetical protein